MDKELEDQLFAIAPEFFKEGGPETNQMAFGFECGNGWFLLVKGLIEYAKRGKEDWDEQAKLWRNHIRDNRYIDTDKYAEKYLNKENPFKDFQIEQVKEKFGTLSFYSFGGDENFASAVKFAAHLSSMMCEKCGDEGEIVNRNGWLKTLCVKHQEEVRLK